MIMTKEIIIKTAKYHRIGLSANYKLQAQLKEYKRVIWCISLYAS